VTALIAAHDGAITVPTTFVIPTSQEEAVSNLSQAQSWVFGGQWITAAYVYAMTEETEGGRPSKTCSKVSRLSMSEFTKLGIRGLSSRNTVAKYRKAWEQAIEIGLAQDVGPGDTVVIPNVDFASAADNHRAKGTGENEWYTPQRYIEMARSVLGEIDLDPATSFKANESVGAAVIFTKEDDGLEQDWHGRVWLNPPYSQPDIALFAEKVTAEVESERVTAAIVLTHNYTDTAWFHRLAGACDAICFTRGRIAFESPTGEKAAPTQGQAFFYFGDNHAAFRSAFGSVGVVMCT
jgi:phage N-6-adenine-methyltransferase